MLVGACIVQNTLGTPPELIVSSPIIIVHTTLGAPSEISSDIVSPIFCRMKHSSSRNDWACFYHLPITYSSLLPRNYPIYTQCTRLCGRGCDGITLHPISLLYPRIIVNYCIFVKTHGLYEHPWIDYLRIMIIYFRSIPSFCGSHISTLLFIHPTTFDKVWPFAWHSFTTEGLDLT